MKEELEIFCKIKNGIFITMNKFDYLEFYFDELNINNHIIIELLKMKNLIKEVHSLASDLLKLSLFNIDFNNNNELVIVITSILSSFQLMIKSSNRKYKDSRVKIFFEEWIINLIENSEFKNTEIKDCYFKLIKFYTDNPNLEISKFIKEKIDVNIV